MRAEYEYKSRDMQDHDFGFFNPTTDLAPTSAWSESLTRISVELTVEPLEEIVFVAPQTPHIDIIAA